MATERSEEMKRKVKEFVHQDDELTRVNDWRRKMFKKVYSDVGYRVSNKTIDRLIASTASHHELRSLLERGCPPKLLHRILA